MRKVHPLLLVLAALFRKRVKTLSLGNQPLVMSLQALKPH